MQPKEADLPLPAAKDAGMEKQSFRRWDRNDCFLAYGTSVFRITLGKQST